MKILTATSGLKTGVGNRMFWSENRAAHPYQANPRSTPGSPRDFALFENANTHQTKGLERAGTV